MYTRTMKLVEGDTMTGAQAINFYMDFTKSDEFELICVNTLSEALNYNVETWYDFCAKGFSSSAVTGIDMEWSGEMVLRYNEATANWYKTRFQLDAVNNIPMRITNELLDEEVEVNVSVTDFSMDVVAEELLKASFTVKPFQGAPTVKPIEPTPRKAPKSTSK